MSYSRSVNRTHDVYLKRNDAQTTNFGEVDFATEE